MGEPTSRAKLPASLEAKVRDIVRNADREEMTMRSVRLQLEEGEGMEAGTCDKYKKSLKAFVATLLAAEEEEEEEEASEDDSDGEAPPPKKAKKRKPAAKEEAPVEDERITALKSLARAVKFGPTLFKGLKDLDDDDERCKTMKQRFAARDITFKGDAPTEKEIRAFRSAKARADDMEGIDTSLIIHGKRTRGGGRTAKPRRTVDSDDEAEFV